MHVESHLSLEQLERLEHGEPDAAKARRLRIIILALKGYAAPSIAMSLGPSRRICQRWVRRYNESGLAGLEDRRGQDPRPLLTPEQEAEIRQRLDAGATAEDGVCWLRGRDIQAVLGSEFGLVRSLAAVYHLLHRLGYS